MKDISKYIEKELKEYEDKLVIAFSKKFYIKGQSKYETNKKDLICTCDNNQFYKKNSDRIICCDCFTEYALALDYSIEFIEISE